MKFFSLLLCCLVCILAKPSNGSADKMHDYVNRRYHNPRYVTKPAYEKEETTKEYWQGLAKETLKKQLERDVLKGHAKNIILFLGDGMSIPTLAATRAYIGQKNGKPGEETELSFEKFPYVGLSKTYCVDRQVADSACSATAYLGGVKANEATAGVTAAVEQRDCKRMNDEKNQVQSIARMFQLKGKRTGVVTTTRITHASPSAVYAHIAHRDWESDVDVSSDGYNPEECKDIAYQLVHNATGNNLNVAFGGGRAGFLPNNTKDEDNNSGRRQDKRHLINEWITNKQLVSHAYVTDKAEMDKVSNDTDYVLGLFASDHLDYHLEKTVKQPTLQEMTLKAISLLSKNNDGYFLFIEGGRIDHAHHSAFARKALDETEQFHLAVEAARKATNPQETLIVVTADHAHTMSVSGYPARGTDILGLSGIFGLDGLPYSTLSYANGPGYRPGNDGKRHDQTNDDFNDINYQYVGIAPLEDETHGGEDVGIYASGPWAHLYTGVLEQHVIPHIMAYASCVTDENNACSASASFSSSALLLMLGFYFTVKITDSL